LTTFDQFRVLASLASFDIFRHVPRGYLSHHSALAEGSAFAFGLVPSGHPVGLVGLVVLAIQGPGKLQVGLVSHWQLDGKGRSREKMINTSGPKNPKNDQNRAIPKLGKKCKKIRRK
jgi:hypothetical protein